MTYEYDLNQIKESITIEQIKDLLDEWHADPQIKGDTIIARTIDHNYIQDTTASYKLYYYDNSKLFVSFTGDRSAFDVFQLTLIVKNREENLNWELPQAVEFIARRVGASPLAPPNQNSLNIISDLLLLERYDKIKEINPKTQEVVLKEYDSTVLNHLPKDIILQPWLDDHINQEVIDSHNIRYNPITGGIVIPHYDMDNRLIGIRERALNQEASDLYGKYRPAYLNGILYRHGLSFCLYNLNNSKENIKQRQAAIVLEGEKGCLQYASYFGAENDISVAACGSSLLAYQAWMLINLGVKEIIIAFDKQYKIEERGQEEHKKLIKNLTNIHKRFGQYVKISFLFDREQLLDYKDSPTDKGKDIFIELYKNKETLY